jgi:predicted HTH domain antitoxin
MIIPDEIVQATGMTEAELRQEIAVLLFQEERLSLAQAAELAGMDRLQLQHRLASRNIPAHYGVDEFQEDLKTLQELRSR